MLSFVRCSRIRPTTLLYRGIRTSPRLFSETPDLLRFGNYDLVLSENPTAVGVSHIAKNIVPDHIKLPPYVGDTAYQRKAGDSFVQLSSKEEVDALRRATRLARRTLELARDLIKVGSTTASIDQVLHNFIVRNGAYPSPLQYYGFPKSCCTSVNNVLVHGIPDNRPLEDGDIVNVDVTVFLDGYHGDCSETFAVGDVDDLGRHLIETSKIALAAGISACGPGRPFKGIGAAISQAVQLRGCSVNESCNGHGIGTEFHRTPWILHHKNDEPGVMKSGHCFTIEPVIVQGDDSRGWMLPDGWTLLTESWARSAQAEHTVLITDTGVDVLTADVA
ncbi:hypothetical protein BS47DRAFT_1291777 [Hydnum rufescens UP504]|uniref:Methionine aminopeptidase n=1 Tax=Hydnum rufescens UP504 TaxID=1448309 RepID=A0A9P6B325_9AGAM|nr:hypothetical protein BS47DRAFT_1291777 [Hydnum rufescens UP504]